MTAMPDAFVAFYTRHYRLILTVAQQRLGGLSDAEDVTAETFRIAWAHHQAGGALALPWLYQTLRNVIGHKYRRRGRAPELTPDLVALDWEGPTPSQVADGIDIRREMDHLSPDDRELLFMAYWEDLTPSEIGEILSVHAGTIRVRLLRARRRLQARLELAAQHQTREAGEL